jgi:hypothetical protein
LKRPALEHIIRAAADITGESEFVVIGSSAVLAQFPNAPEIMLRSNEADIYPPNAPEKSWDIEGSLGSGSQFHATFGYFADGVGPETSRLPHGWQDRAYVLRTPNTGGAKAICPEIHDLAASKTLAGRDKDREWVAAGVVAKLIDVDVLRNRIEEIDVSRSTRETALRRLRSWLGRSSRRT